MSGKAYTCRWFESYITGRKKTGLIGGVKSILWKLLLGLPQTFILRPLLFIIYMGPFGKILHSLGIHFHFHADDSQIYVTFNISEYNSAAKIVEEAVRIIKKWMAENVLCFNRDKMEVLLIASKTYHSKLDI